MASLTANSACGTGSLTGSSTRQLSTPALGGVATAAKGLVRCALLVRFPSQRPNIYATPVLLGINGLRRNIRSPLRLSRQIRPPAPEWRQLAPCEPNQEPLCVFRTVGTRSSSIPNRSRYTPSTSSSVPNSRSSCAPSAPVALNVRPLSVILPPSSATLEHTSDCTKCDLGEVLCHHAPATKSPSSRGRVSSRYCGPPFITTSRSGPASAIRNTPPGSFCSPLSANASGWWLCAPNPTSASHSVPSIVRTRSARWSYGIPSRPASPCTRAASRV